LQKADFNVLETYDVQDKKLNELTDLMKEHGNTEMIESEALLPGEIRIGTMLVETVEESPRQLEFLFIEEKF